MKTNFFKLILPMAVITFGIAGAVSTNAMNKKAGAMVDRIGYNHLEGEDCIETNITCTTSPGSPCTFGGNQLYDFNTVTNSCPNPLNKI